MADRSLPPKTLRRKSREFALQMLFQWEMGREEPSKLKKKFWRVAHGSPDTRAFANKLFEGAVSESASLDELIGRFSENWSTARMAAIDRAILYLAVYELNMRTEDSPLKVVVTEAVELAKKYSSDESASFISGVLNAIHNAPPDPQK
jgi:transcription antitermination protein NusB